MTVPSPSAAPQAIGLEAGLPRPYPPTTRSLSCQAILFNYRSQRDNLVDRRVAIRTRKSRVFARFLKKHSSPTHNRVTAGGRIVPMEQRGTPPRFDLPQPGQPNPWNGEPIKQALSLLPNLDAAGSCDQSHQSNLPVPEAVRSPISYLFRNDLHSPPGGISAEPSQTVNHETAASPLDEAVTGYHTILCSASRTALACIRALLPTDGHSCVFWLARLHGLPTTQLALLADEFRHSWKLAISRCIRPGSSIADILPASPAPSTH